MRDDGGVLPLLFLLWELEVFCVLVWLCGWLVGLHHTLLPILCSLLPVFSFFLVLPLASKGPFRYVDTFFVSCSFFRLVSKVIEGDGDRPGLRDRFEEGRIVIYSEENLSLCLALSFDLFALSSEPVSAGCPRDTAIWREREGIEVLQ